jgi:hypothetical protein
MYTTYYCASNGQPRNNVDQHEDIWAALAAWKANIGALLAGSGGESVLVEDGDDLRWIESAEGGYVAGTLAPEGLDDEDYRDAEYIASVLAV